jgi:hypothetical protein
VCDFFSDIPKKAQRFLGKALGIQDWKEGCKITESQKLLDKRGHLKKGQYGASSVVLKQPRNPLCDERGNFNAFRGH